jgi:tetratricopeptide (TPR) repeat protein
MILDDAGRTLARLVYAETSGNPLFVGEVLRHLTESGAIVQREGRWVSTGSLADMGIPATIRDVVLRRVGRLSRVAIEALTLAAVIGRHFDLATLVAISELDEDALVIALEEASAARLIEEADVDTWRFSHALVRAALRRTLSATRRVRLHRRVAQAIEARHPDDVTALAYHFTEAGPELLAKAIDYTIEAGDQARAQLAHDQAVHFYERAIAMISSAQRLDDARRCEVLIRLGVAQKHAGDPAHRETLLDAANLARRLGDTDRLVRAALANNRGWVSRSGGVDTERVAALEAALAALDETDSAARAMLLATLAAELLFSGDRARRCALSDAALAMARRIADPTTLAHVLNVRSHVIWAPDTLDERLANSAEHVTIARRLTDPLARWYASATRPQTCMEAGDLREVDHHLTMLSQLTVELGQPHQRWAATIDFAWRTLLRGNLAEAERLATEAYEIGTATGQQDALVYYAGQLFAIRWDQGRLGELTPVIEQAAAQNPGIPAFNASLALAYCELDQFADARRVLDAAFAARFDDIPLDMAWLTAMAAYAEVAARLGVAAPAALLRERLSPWPTHVIFNGLYVFGSVSRSLGLLATTLGLLDDADRHFATAAATHERLEAAALLARTHLDWAIMLRARSARGDVDRARELLDDALRDARQLGLAGIAQRAAALLQQ